MNDDGVGEGIWRDENTQRGNARRLGSLENYKLKSLGTMTQKADSGVRLYMFYNCAITLELWYQSQCDILSLIALKDWDKTLLDVIARLSHKN